MSRHWSCIRSFSSSPTSNKREKTIQRNGQIRIMAQQYFLPQSSSTNLLTQFRLLYWASSFCNIGRLLFLIAVTIAMEFELGVAGWEWLAAYIYTFTNCIVILIYLLGFSTGQSA